MLNPINTPGLTASVQKGHFQPDPYTLPSRVIRARVAQYEEKYQQRYLFKPYQSSINSKPQRKRRLAYGLKMFLARLSFRHIL